MRRAVWPQAPGRPGSSEIVTMRIAHVITRLLRAGSEENTVATCLDQANAGHDVLLIHGRDFDTSYYNHLDGKFSLVCAKWMTHPIRPLADALAFLEVRAILKGFKADIVHTHQSKAGLIGRLAARSAGVPYIVHGVHIVPFLAVSPAKRLLYVGAERLAARMTDAFIDVSAGMRDACLQEGIGHSSNHTVVYSGIDLKRFRNAVPPEHWRSLCGIPPAASKPPIILMLAALEPRKRHIELIEAFRSVVATHPRALLLLAGEGPARTAIEKEIDDHDLRQNVRLLGYHSEPECLIALADLCILTSKREGLPRVVVQYVAGGRPCIATRVPGIEEILSDGSNGIISDPEDLSDTSAAITRLLNRPRELARLRLGAVKTDTSRWDVETMCAEINSIYQRLIAYSSTAPPR